TMTPPATNLTGTITLASTSSDAANGSGVASVRYEYKPTSGSTWVTACTSSTSPYSCSFNTGSATDGLYDFRAVAIDGVNLTGTSAAVTSRRIDNTAPGATMGALAANLTGSVSLTSTLIDGGSGVASAQYQYKLTSDSTWTNACSSSTSPYSCSFNTASVSDGLYDVRVIATDNVGNAGTSTAVFSRRIDNTNPTVTMGSVPAWVDASISLTSNPADDGGIASVQYQYKLSTSGIWLTACNSASTPFSCSYNTAALTNGSLYDFRVTATDNAGRTATSGTVQSRMDHVNPAVTLTAPATNLGGSVTLASTPTDANSGVDQVQYQYKLSSSGTWLDACSASSSPWTCAFDISGLADGFYDFRVIATDNVGRTAPSAASTGRRIDNTDPATATLNAVGTPLSGTVAFGGAATDNGGGSGIATWAVQYSPAGTGTWTTLCSDNATPYACNGNVDAIADGLYDFRALATDNAGNTRASTVQTNRRIDTDGPVASVTSPVSGTRVRGNVTLTANATDPVGVQRVEFQVFYLGAWLTFCTDYSASYPCTGDSTGVADGTYQVRVVATDTLNHSSNSAPITLIIDNTGPVATDVQATNGGTGGRIDSGDSMTFTWNEAVTPASIMTGWSGASQPIRVFVDNNVAGNNDGIFIYHPTANTRLNVTSATGLRLNTTYVTGDVWLNGTMTMSGNSVTVTVGSLISGTSTGGVTGNATMQWNSSNATTDSLGNTGTGNTVNESGGGDRDF
ncbi:MAG TPA: Ig-like domain-containing protein, partial [Ilumatobacteraceae bacterium]|nr:Ig-like domain-containing protein [Ilumatobacteraceae bacterium]